MIFKEIIQPYAHLLFHKSKLFLNPETYLKATDYQDV